MRSVKDWFRVRAATGDVGIEIEAEGKRLPQEVDKFWKVTHDGSLRGESMEECCEYVLKRPMSLTAVREALDYLAHQYKENEAQVDDSPRCGVHVHVNCQQLNIIQLYNFITLYLILEELLVKFCGKTREGNLFCLRAKDAEYLLYTLSQALEDKEFRRRFGTDDLRYASMNVKALCNYGSLEFRAMRGTEDMDTVYQWAALLVNLRKVGKTYPNPSEIIIGMSAGGYENFMHFVLSKEDASILMSYEGWEQMLTDGMRRAQDVAFAGDWEALATFPKRKIGGIEVNQNFEDDFPPMDL